MSSQSVRGHWTNTERDNRTAAYDPSLAKDLYRECQDISQKYNIEKYLDVKYLTHFFENHGDKIN